jgi:hypothetical protein
LKDKRTLIDKILSEYCDYLGVTWTDLHEEAFCVQHKRGYWLYIWYDEYDHIPVSIYLKELESLMYEGVLNIKEIKE